MWVQTTPFKWTGYEIAVQSEQTIRELDQAIKHGNSVIFRKEVSSK